MFLNILKAKIHRAVVTQRNIDYQGSISIDADILDQAGILPNEAVLVADLNNGSRHTTYAIAAPRGTKTVMVNGAAARLVEQGDKVIVMAYALMTPDEAQTHKPTILLMNDDNSIQEVIR